MPSHNKINLNKAVIFDFDDTLAKTRYGKSLGLKLVSLKIHNFLEEQGVGISFKNLYQKIKKITSETENKRIYDRNLWWLFAIKGLFKITPRNNFLDELTVIYWDAVKKKSELYTDALPTIAYLKEKKYALGMVTDNDGVKELKAERIKKLKLKKWFDSVVVAGEDVKQTKPDKTPFFLIAKKLNLKPHQCLFVGNNLSLDILGAKKTGMTAVLIKRDDCKAKIKPDYIIHKLIDLKKILS